MLKRLSRGFLLFWVIVYSGSVPLKGKVFAQTLPFTDIKPPATNIRLFIVVDPSDAQEAESLILSLGGTVVSTTTSDLLFPSTPGVQYIKAAGSSPFAFYELPPPGFIQFTAVFPDPYAAYSILWSSSSVYLLGIIISPFYGSAIGFIKAIGGSLDMQGTHILVDEVTGETICKLSSADRLILDLDKYFGALVGSVTVSGEFSTVINLHPPYFILKVKDISLAQGLNPGSNILHPFLSGPFLSGLGFSPLPSALAYPIFNFLNPGYGWGLNFISPSIQFMPFFWPRVIPYPAAGLGGLMNQPFLSYGFPFPYTLLDDWLDFDSTPSDPELSNWIWTSPTTAYNPNTPPGTPGLQQTYFVSIPAGSEQESPYYQQNFDLIYPPVYVPGIGTVYPY